MRGLIQNRSVVLVVALLGCCAAFGPGFARADVLTRLDRFDPHELKFAGFTLDAEQEVTIHAVGSRHELNDAWILDAATRQVVWEMRDADSERRSKYLRDFSDDVELKAGRYEVYYSSFPDYEDDFSGIWRWFRSRDDDYDGRRYERAVSEFMIVVEGDGKALVAKDIEDYHASLGKNAILSLTRLDGDRYEKKGLTLDRDMELEIYAVGELRRDEFYDCSWIVDDKTNEKVWQFDYWDSDPAGGAKKNRVFKGTVSLPKGSYTIFSVTDDSHHYDDWNSAPPYDPLFWGLTIQAADPKSTRYAKIREPREVGRDQVIVDLTRLGDDDVRSQGFSLKKPMKLRIYAIGEGHGRDMYDYSRIVDADTREVVWEMKGRETEHAGGASKNRVFDRIVNFDKGDYIAYAMTDGSHSYDDWNASPPFDKKSWGLTVMVAEGSMRDVADYEVAKAKNVLVELVGVGNNEREHARFELERDSEVRIYAIGEGSGGRMYDYAWIEDAETGRVMWEMTYRMTDHAGGARKNRVFNDTIKLGAGKYIVYYESDGSHSFQRWNASPPADPFSWGVTVKLAEGS